MNTEANNWVPQSSPYQLPLPWSNFLLSYPLLPGGRDLLPPPYNILLDVSVIRELICWNLEVIGVWHVKSLCAAPLGSYSTDNQGITWVNYNWITNRKMTHHQNQRVPSGLISKSRKFLGIQLLKSVGKTETGEDGEIPTIKSSGIVSHLFPEKWMSHLSVVICSTTPSLPQPSRNEQVSNKSCILNRKWFFSWGCLKKKQAAVSQMARSDMTVLHSQP